MDESRVVMAEGGVARGVSQGQSQIQEMGAAGVVTGQGPRGTQLGTGSPRHRCRGCHSRLNTPADHSQGPPNPARRHTPQGAGTVRGCGSPQGTERSGRRH